MAQITGGNFRYLRVVKDDDFGIKREFQAELSFSVGENESPSEISDFVAQKVVDITHEKLRIRSSAPTTGAAAGEVQAKPGSPPSAPPPAAAPASPPTDKDRLAAEAVAKATPAPKKAPKIEKKAAEDDDMAALLGEETVAAAKIITDKDLSDAVTKKNATLKKPQAIVALKETYTGPLPKQMRNIPQEKRAQFLIELEALS